jgi:predicted flap endonuclease-1-like 5' DNA nuclease
MLHRNIADGDTNMAWLADFQEKSKAQAQKALAIPVGMSSPLWLAFGAATSAGVAWWWMTRWTKATNLEALTPIPTAKPVKAPRMVIELLEAEPAPAPVTIPAPILEPEDLTLLVGIGPKLSAALAERGVTRFEHIAAWTAKDLAKFDAELSLKGRAVRDAWVAQAQRLAKDPA